ncbi:pimeloyl-ACP methyl ester carboxylesterase [Kribbella orskensis]|uniref:Pimeloyl-ACP methyl ester carboxylesterase n=1 Tax=Kribbella orskensis TaxID=2512216 RepID=A0ABY2BCZ9_9ACTN|nr:MULTISPECIES: alpha/beta hydrolase [Kribbella]TCN35006.1 pimeloyl-ACP methyl ester carboxylesterase [Kribbella sp. VKM Ac-2500]TCO16373.1 pimeloyl-ACP methyl ester carboxylesterase [Kribbella orskensis]
MSETTLTVVLVHGAFADASSWSGVISELKSRGIPAIAVANELRGPGLDGARVAAQVREIDGPVVLVGHSYGGAVITAAANAADNVTGLVYVAAFAPDEGESLQDLLGSFPANDFASGLAPHVLPTADGGEEVFLGLKLDLFHQLFAADVTAEEAQIMGRTQRPIAAVAFEEKSGPASWKRIPSYTLVATGDEAIHPDGQRKMAARANATTIEVDGSHAVAVSQPKAVAAFIASAVEGGAAR